MYQGGMSEKAIQEGTGHIMSLTSLRHYERTNLSQQQAVARVIAFTHRSTFQELYLVRSTNSMQVAMASLAAKRTFIIPPIHLPFPNVHRRFLGLH